MTYSMYKAQTMCVKIDDDKSLECPVCTEEFEHPKLLPCYHTYCLKCLTQYCCEEMDGDTKPCPMCRREFFIPKGGVENIPDNQFMMRLILTRKDCKQEKQYNCEICLEIGENCEAKAFCSECRQYLCERCKRIHLVSATSKSHNVIDIDQMTTEEELLRLPSSNCLLHVKEMVFYCCDCNIPLCFMCQFESHGKHKCQLLSDFVKTKKEAFDWYDRSLRNGYEVGSGRVMNFQKQREDTLLKVSAATQSVEQAFSNIVARITSRKTQLLQNIQEIKRVKLKGIDSEEDLDQMHLAQVNSFLSYSRLAMERGTDIEIIRVADELHKRAEELIKSQDERNKQQLPDLCIKFVPSPELTSQDLERFIGKISDKDEPIGSPVPPVPISNKPIQLPGGIKGLAVLNEQMFLVSDDRLQVSVYDIHNSKVVCQIDVPDMKSPDGLAFCSHNKALYISDGQKDCIHKVSLDENKTNLWMLNKLYEPSGLSVTAEHNLLVTVQVRSNGEAAVFEYSSEGRLIRDIKLNKSITEAWQTVQLSSDQFIVCHGSDSSLHRICLTNSKGQIIKSYGGKGGRDRTLLNSPISLAIDYNKGHIFVADNGNNRVLMFTTDLKFLCQAQTGSELSKPSCLYFDSSSDRLFIGEWTGRVVIVSSPDRSV